ncbi:flagellar protein FlaG [Cohnella sp. NL03-T5]|nr:flagellar protein FlaG [Cohnella silvisoli]
MPERNVSSATETPLAVTEFPSLTTLKQTEHLGGQITISDQQVLRAIEKAIKAIEGATTSLQFTIHERTKHISVKVLNSETGEIIREIPPEKNLDFLANLWEKAGILVDERR